MSDLNNLFVSVTTSHLITIANSRHNGDIEQAKQDIALEFSNIVNFTQDQSNVLASILKDKTNLLEDLKSVEAILKGLNTSLNLNELDVSVSTIDVVVKTMEHLIKECVGYDI